MLSSKRLKGVAIRLAKGGRWSAHCDGQVIVMPAAGVPPEFMDVVVHSQEDHVLRTSEHISGRLGNAIWASSCARQIVVMPAGAVPPEFVHVIVDAHIIHMLRTLRRK